jgi:arginase
VSNIEIILAEIGEGAQIVECKAGPSALREHVSKMESLSWGSVVTSDAQLPNKLAVVEDFMPRLATAVAETMAYGKFPVVIGGDHSCAIGTWSAIASHYKADGDIGLIWIDAHLDSHTPLTSGSGAPHGMPLASLLGYGTDALTNLMGWQFKVKPQNVVVIGARSSEVGEEQLLENVGVRVMRIEEVTRRGFSACLQEAIEIVSEQTVGYGITFDVDALDPLEAPGVGSPEEGGLSLAEVVNAFKAQKPDLLGFELVEYNPERDSSDLKTANACWSILQSILK